MDDIDPETIWIFSPLDKWMKVKKNEKETFVKLFSRKKILIENVQSMKIDAKVYKKLMKSSYKSPNEFVRKCAEEDLLKLKDAKKADALEQWFKQMIEDTGKDYDEQQGLYNNYTKGENIKKGSSLVQVKKSMAKSSLKKNQIKNKTNELQINFTEVVSFRAADNLLDHFQGNVVVYDKVLDRKAKMLSLVQKKKFDGQMYKKMLEQILPKIKNEEILFDTQFEYDNLKDIHDGNVVPWFQELIEETRDRYTEQCDNFKKLKQRSKLKKQTGPGTIKQVVNGQNLEPALKYSVIKNVQLNVNSIFSFQALMDFIKNNEENPQLVLQLRQRVRVLLQEYQNKVLTASKYKNLIQRNAKECSDDVKESIAFELNLLKEVNNGDVQDWFQDIVGAAKQMESQGKPSQKQMKKNKQAVQSENKRKLSGLGTSLVKINLEGLSQIEISRDIYFRQVKSFRAIDYFMNQFKKNPETYKNLMVQKESLLKEVNSNQLNAERYLYLLQAQRVNTLNQQINKWIQFDLKNLSEKYKGNTKEWFESVMKETKNQHQNQKNIFNSHQTQKKPGTSSVSSNAVSNIPKYELQRKSYLFLRAMSIYESLLYFHRKNKIPYDNHKYLIEYQKKTKKKAHQYLDQMQRNKNFDVQNLINDLFPPLNQHIFYNGSFEYGKKKMDELISGLTAQINALKKYSSQVKKAMNVQNLETVRKQIAKCEQNIKKLKEWPHSRFEPFPDVKIEKVQKMNMDINKLEPNQLQIIVTNIEGLSSEHSLFIYIGSFQEQKFKSQVVNGSQSNVRLVQKLSEKQMGQIMKGSKNLIMFRFFKKGFFSGMELIAEVQVESHFSRANILEGKVLAGNIGVYYILKVQKPNRPLYTEINHFNITFFPSYEHSSFIEEQLIKKHIPYTNPTPSEIHS